VRAAAGGVAGPVDLNEGIADAPGAVVLLDEIDKADPDVPNDLLEPLGLYRFRTESGAVVEAALPPLVVLTTNEERDLPRAFLRRCVVHVLPPPTRARLRQIAVVRQGGQDVDLYDEIVQALAGPADDDERVDVSIAEFLDVAAAARTLGVGPGHPSWSAVLGATTAKRTELELS
jgi:MoxR-like ATPase